MHVPETEMGPWTPARFPSSAARDRFLNAVAGLQITEVEGAVMPNEARAALVRWRPGHFLGLNDIAYSLGGRILVDMSKRHA